MLQFLADTQAPDGTWPMVNDSVPGYPMDPRSVLLAGAVLLNHEEWVTQAKGADTELSCMANWEVMFRRRMVHGF